MVRKINEKELRRHMLEQLEHLTNPVVYQYGYESLDSIYYKLCGLLILAETFGITGYELEQVKIAEQKYYRKIVDKQKRREL